ncbi:hypothetical protein Tco_0890511 [Tanacetum coccineum]|uniref:Reverse transcriptase domain-containing protein n=1 Tax=Tanacetum coccineum TaxID=301880 RepID=A0ABQ5C676_9ASTR
MYLFQTTTIEIGIRAKVIENQQSYLLHHPLLPTLPSTPTLSPAEPSGEPMMRRIRGRHSTGAAITLMDSPTAESTDMLLSRIPEEDLERNTPMKRMRMMRMRSSGIDIAPTDSTFGDYRPAQSSISLQTRAEDGETSGHDYTITIHHLLTITTPAGECLSRCRAPPGHIQSPLTSAFPKQPPQPPSLYILKPPADRHYKWDRGGVLLPEDLTIGRWVDYGFISTVDAEARRQGISEVGYGIRDTWVDPAEAVPEIAPMTVGEWSGLTRWIEKMESVFNISGCAIENQVKFATCTLLGAALTWWNGQIRTLGPEAYAMTWEVLKKKMTDKYCPQGEIKKLEIKCRT